METIEVLLDRIISREGGYVNHPDDRGGETIWGITKWVARKNGYTGAMKDMPREEAERIYREEYFKAPGFDVVSSVYPGVAAELFDSGVNLGQHWPALWLQMCLNSFNMKGDWWPDIAEDGDIGPATMRALRAYKDRRGAAGEVVMLKLLNCLQGARYCDIARSRVANESFIYGWIDKRIEI